MKPSAAVLILLALAACSSDRSFTDALAGDRVRGDSEAVTVAGADSLPDALPLAMGHCAHFHRAAQYAGHDADRFRFRCIAR